MEDPAVNAAPCFRRSRRRPVDQSRKHDQHRARRLLQCSHDGGGIGSASQASAFLKALSHEARLIILCLLVEGEKSVSEIEQMLSLRQPSVSQQLAGLRAEGFVETRRKGKTSTIPWRGLRCVISLWRCMRRFVSQNGRDRSYCCGHWR